MKQRLDFLRASLGLRAMQSKSPQYAFRRPPKAKFPIFWATGGIGDLIVNLEAIEAFQEYVGGPVVVYSKFPEIGRYFSSKLIHAHEDLFRHKGADWWIKMGTMARFNISPNFSGFENSKVADLYFSNLSFMTHNEWKDVLELEPYLDNIMAEKAVAAGLNRRTLPYHCLGLTPKPMIVPIREHNNYITVHDGFDGNNSGVSTRATKTWSMDNWTQLIRMLRQSYPKTPIVQLGGPTSRSIKGVDQNFAGNCHFEVSMEMLKNSFFHVDGDSGLVHAAARMGVTSAVMFGPTNHQFFSYENNINIAPKYCGNCWWLKIDWLSKCAAGYEKPECMDSITPADVITAITDRMEF